MDVGEAITTERHNTHGDFEQNARISQMIKCALRQGIYSDVQKEVIDMIALKLSRIASGQANHDDHWIDIIGYATLALNDLKRIAETAIPTQASANYKAGY